MEVKILTQHYDKPEYKSLDGYKKYDGYNQLKKALTLKPDEITEMVKQAGLRGRGGAGFPAGVKWSFLPKNNKTRYLICNADEGEPGTFKDREMMDKAPHQLIEGMIISAFAIGSPKSYIYIRGEYFESKKIVEQAIKEAYENNLLGDNILKSGFSHHMDIYSGAGAYICGEETGLISSLEGKKGQPKLKPPFPAVEGYLANPTIVNNVETLASVTVIIRDGVDGYRKHGTEKSPGTKLFSVSGNVVKPGNYEVPLGYPLKDIIFNLCGGLKEGRKLKAVIPGGSSAPVLNAEEAMSVNMDYEDLASKGSMLGSGAIIVIDDSNSMVELLKVLMNFYHHESCGQCTPCREGTGWLLKLSNSILSGSANLNDVALLEKVASHMKGKTICALSDAAAFPVLSFVSKFKEEFTSYATSNVALKFQATNVQSYKRG
ncbi:MAG: NADH-quinone oxidoreductase subunit NuoF [Bdellovibrionales bacterium]|nr:NADH-quinone oxidoreductase subunit NuoF [Bdellovibrionales bacterium]